MHYHWQNTSSLIQDAEFYAPGKEEEAVLYAPAGAAPEKLWAIADAIRGHGFVAEPDMEGDHYVLRVRNLPSHDALLGVMKQENLISGEPQTHKTKHDAAGSHTLRPQQVTGLLYMLGDSIMVGTGMMRNGWKGGGNLWEVMSGPGKKDITSCGKWLTSGIMLFFLGAKDPDKQAHYAYDDLLAGLKKEGYHLEPEQEAILKSLAHHKDGALPKLERLIRENPLVINSILQAAGGADAAMAGIDQKRPDGSANWIKSASGASTFLGHTTALLTDEKKPDPTVPKDPHRSLIQKFNDWRHEKKFRIAGGASVISSLLRIVGGYQEVKINDAYLKGYDKAAVNNVLQGTDTYAAMKEAEAMHATFTRVDNARHAAKIEWGVNCVKAVANWYYALAGGNINADIKQLGILDEMSNTAAHIAHNEPDEKLRAGLVSSIATMLADQKGIDNTATEIREIIERKLIAMQHNPWEKGATQTPAQKQGNPVPQVHHVASHTALHAATGVEAQL